VVAVAWCAVITREVSGYYGGLHVFTHMNDFLHSDCGMVFSVKTVLSI
jgi:hypothetical protein